MAVPRIPTRDRGPLLLIALGILSFLFALLSGCFLTADCVSREKREGTLGLLFLTPLRYRDVVLGKLVSNSIVVVYGLLAVFPVFFLPLLHGGVTWAEVVRVLLALLVCLSLSLTVGMLCSVCSSEAKTAVAATFAIVLLLAVVPFGYALLQAGFQGRPPTFLGAAQFSPTVLLLLSFDEAYRLVSPFAFWGSVALQGLLTLGVVLLSVTLLSRRWLTSKPPPGRRPRKAPRTASSTLRHPHRHLPPRVNPYAWAAGRGSAEPVWFRALRGSMLLLIASMTVLAVTTPHWEEGYSTAFITAYVLHLTTKFMMALEATRPLHADRMSGALELVLVTPVGARCALPGAHRAFRDATRLPFWGLIGVNLGLLVAAFVFPERLHMNSEALAGFTTLYVGGMATASADRRALAWVGLRQSLIAPTHLRAALMTLTQVMLPGWLLFGGALLVLANARSGSTLTLILMFWYIGCLMSSLAVTIHSRTHLQHRFRELATGGLG